MCKRFESNVNGFVEAKHWLKIHGEYYNLTDHSFENIIKSANSKYCTYRKNNKSCSCSK